MAFTRVTHVIFDVDGLLLDTEVLYEQADKELLSSYGCEFSWSLQQKLMGTTDLESTKIVVDEFNLNVSPDLLLEQYNKIADNLLPFCKEKPGAQTLIPMAICTGGASGSFSLKTSRHDWFSLFEHVITATDDPRIKSGKPAPDCFQICATQFRSPPVDTTNVLVFEDAPNGVQAALAANMQVVMVPDPRVDLNTRNKATLWLQSLEHFEPEKFGLPPF